MNKLSLRLMISSRFEFQFFLSYFYLYVSRGRPHTNILFSFDLKTKTINVLYVLYIDNDISDPVNFKGQFNKLMLRLRNYNIFPLYYRQTDEKFVREKHVAPKTYRYWNYRVALL